MRASIIRSHRLSAAGASSLRVTGAVGSTLVEVVVTIGILVSTLLPLITLLSMAMDTSGQATNNTLCARVASQLIGEVQQADWQNLETWNGRDVYYDDQGQLLKSADVKEDSVIVARTILSPANAGVTLETGGSAPSNPWQRKLLVMVAARGGDIGKRLLDNAANALSKGDPLPKDVIISRSMIVNMQKSS